MLDAVIISDLHLGSRLCQAGPLSAFLDYVPTIASRLIMNGDVFDTADYRRLRPEHWRIIQQIRQLTRTMEVIWVAGNHDEPRQMVGLAEMCGLKIVPQYTMPTGDSTLLCLHGDYFDDFIRNHPTLTAIGDFLYNLATVMDRSHKLARWLKKASKEHLDCVKKVRKGACDYAGSCGFDLVACGHTHLAETVGQYANSGCWTEVNNCTWVSVLNGHLTLNHWDQP